MSELLPESTNLPTPESTILPDGENVFTAYEIHDPWDMPVVNAPIDRNWMDEAHQRHPYRCLPLVIANQSGWMLLSPCTFRIFWYGGLQMTDLEVDFPSGVKDPHYQPFRQRGADILDAVLVPNTPGINLWVKGPTNWIKDGVQPLEGVVEADWSAATFTMNWKVTRPNHWITFEKGEPFCMLVPVPRGLAETLQTQSVPLAANPELYAQYKTWEAGRSRFLEGLSKNEQAIVKQGWQKEYFQGKLGTGGRFEEHQTHLALKPFLRKKPAE